MVNRFTNRPMKLTLFWQKLLNWSIQISALSKATQEGLMQVFMTKLIYSATMNEFIEKGDLLALLIWLSKASVVCKDWSF